MNKVTVKVYYGQLTTAQDKLKEDFGDRVVIESCSIATSMECANEARGLGFKAIVPFIVIGDTKIEDASNNWNGVRTAVCNELSLKFGVC